LLLLLLLLAPALALSRFNRCISDRLLLLLPLLLSAAV
jgi:hypothetical protein